MDEITEDIPYDLNRKEFMSKIFSLICITSLSGCLLLNLKLYEDILFESAIYYGIGVCVILAIVYCLYLRKGFEKYTWLSNIIIILFSVIFELIIPIYFFNNSYADISCLLLPFLRYLECIPVLFFFIFDKKRYSKTVFMVVKYAFASVILAFFCVVIGLTLQSAIPNYLILTEFIFTLTLLYFIFFEKKFKIKDITFICLLFLTCSNLIQFIENFLTYFSRSKELFNSV